MTGPLSELQISYVCREVLQVRGGLVGLGGGRALPAPQALTAPMPFLFSRDWPICTHRRRYTGTLRWSSDRKVALVGGGPRRWEWYLEGLGWH